MGGKDIKILKLSDKLLIKNPLLKQWV